MPLLCVAVLAGMPPVAGAQPFPQVLSTAVNRIGANLSSTRVGDGRGSVPVNVAVVDTGIDLRQRDLNVVGGKKCNRTGRGYGDVEGHGTFVAGILAARDNHRGVAGIAPGARLWSVRVLNRKESGTDRELVCGINWITATRTDRDPRNDIAVANLSLGDDTGRDDGNCGRTDHDPVHRAICRSIAAGVTYVVAPDNVAADLQRQSPAAYDDVLAVTDVADFDGAPGGLRPQPCFLSGTPLPDDAAVFNSSFATLPSDAAHTVAAPGACVRSLRRHRDPRSLLDIGTSFAAPVVSGVVALCIASHACAGLTPREIIAKIVSDTAAYNVAHPDYGFQGDPLRPVSGRYYGYLVNAALY